jgi:hypothetical protein
MRSVSAIHHPFVQSFAAALKPSALLASLLVLGACAGGPSGEGSVETRIGSAIIFGGRPLPDAPVIARDYTCPSATLLEGTASWRVGGGDPARGVSYQASINDLARECRLVGTTLAIKVGVQGRLVLGESGKPGNFSVPVRVAVRKGEQTVYSKLLAASVTVPANDTQAPFVVIDEGVSLPVGEADPGDEYTILVGLDPQGRRPAERRRRR